MKMTLTFKTPDVLDEMEHLFGDDEDDGCGEFEEEKKIRRLVEKYVRYSEYITVEFDSETNTVKVLEQ